MSVAPEIGTKWAFVYQTNPTDRLAASVDSWRCADFQAVIFTPKDHTRIKTCREVTIRELTRQFPIYSEEI